MSVRAWAEATVASRDAVDTVELLMGAVLGCQVRRTRAASVGVHIGACGTVITAAVTGY